jgi:hypothetical protein
VSAWFVCKWIGATTMADQRTNPPSPATLRLERLQADAYARRELLDSARRELQDGFLAEAIGDLLQCVRPLSHAEETVMQVHAECVAMIESSRKVLELDASLRPVQILIPKEQNDE